MSRFAVGNGEVFGFLGPNGAEREASMLRRALRAGRRASLRRGPFEIGLDGTSAGLLTKLHETVEIAVGPGHHTLRIRSGRYSSHQRSFDVGDGEGVNFRTRGSLFWPMYVASTVKPDLAISLKRE
jgi:hypothetical protein